MTWGEPATSELFVIKLLEYDRSDGKWGGSESSDFIPLDTTIHFVLPIFKKMKHPSSVVQAAESEKDL